MPEHHQMSLPLLTLEQAQAEGRAVLEKAHKQGRFIPNMHAAMAHVPGLLEIYLAGYDTLRRHALGQWGDLSIGGDGPLDEVHRDQLTRLRVDTANLDFLQKLASRLRAREIMTLPSLKPELP